jgi:hypothetical protein
LTTVYAGVRPLMAEAGAQRARQTGDSLADLHSFAADLRDRGARGRDFTAEEADVLGAQEQAEAIAGQITQAAARLNIEIEEG